MGLKAKDAPDWIFISCPVCGARPKQHCHELVTIHARGYTGEPAIHRRDKPHQARVERSQRMPL